MPAPNKMIMAMRERARGQNARASPSDWFPDPLPASRSASSNGEMVSRETPRRRALGPRACAPQQMKWLPLCDYSAIRTHTHSSTQRITTSSESTSRESSKSKTALSEMSNNNRDELVTTRGWRARPAGGLDGCEGEQAKTVCQASVRARRAGFPMSIVQKCYLGRPERWLVERAHARAGGERREVWKMPSTRGAD